MFTNNQEGDKITLLCDGDGDLVKNMGLADDMGFGIGVRSKRFAMVTENGKVAELVTDEGMDDCSSTSAEKLIERLTPEAVGSEAGVDIKVLGGAASVVAVVARPPTRCRHWHHHHPLRVEQNVPRKTVKRKVRFR